MTASASPRLSVEPLPVAVPLECTKRRADALHFVGDQRLHWPDMKRFRYSLRMLLIALPVAALFAACGGGDGDSPTTQTDENSTSAFGGIAGVVLTASGSPQSAVHVRAISASDSSVQAGKFTAANGSYRIDGLPPGAYEVVVENIDGRGSPAVTRNRISNSVTAATPEFPDEYYSAATETANDDPALSGAVVVTANQLLDGVNFVLNDSGTPGNHVLPGAQDITPIAIGSAVNGALGEAGDFTDDVGLGVFVDYYSFTGAAGQRVAVTVDSPQFDTVLIVWGAGGFNATDDDSGAGTNSALTLTLPEVGTYIIGVTSFSQDQLGSYTLTLQEAAPDTTPAIAFGTPVDGVLESTDTATSGFYEDTYKFDAVAGTAYTLTLTSGVFDTFLMLVSPTNQVQYNDDEMPSVTNSRLSGTLGETGTWYVIVSSFTPGTTGAYQLTLTTP